MIETFYRRFKEGDTSYRQIPVSGGYVIDFQYMTQISINDPTRQCKVMQSTYTSDRERSRDNFKWNDSDFLKPKHAY